jgi:hypothetical protein
MQKQKTKTEMKTVHVKLNQQRSNTVRINNADLGLPQDLKKGDVVVIKVYYADERKIKGSESLVVGRVNRVKPSTPSLDVTWPKQVFSWPEVNEHVVAEVEVVGIIRITSKCHDA